MTLQGDKYEPSGLLHGGSQNNVDHLKKVQEYIAVSEKRKQAQKALYDLLEEQKTLKELES